MKRIIIVAMFLLGLSALKANAQYVRVRPGFSVGISIGAPGPAPYAGAIWVGPEWTWRGGRYVEVPGYWERPYRHRHAWVPGHWRYTRRGYRWIPGHWR
jgi:WXXGXW repeat (2 copies)